MEPAATASVPKGVSANGNSVSRPVLFGLGALLFASVVLAARPGLDAPWIQGDEILFIAGNSDVTGEGRTDSIWQRYIGIFEHVHGDLYQPLPILTYAIEWRLWGDARIVGIRLTDVLLHALNGLLVWLALHSLLQRFVPHQAGLALFSWSAAFLWALHPTLVTAYAADMGRTHLLAATFALLSLWLHLRALGADRGRAGLFAATLLLLVFANLSKAIAGWPLLILLIEWGLIGLRATLRSARIYLVTLISAGFAILTMLTSRESGITEDAELALFGDPASRSLLAFWLYVRNVVAPGWASPWHVPDIRTGWNYPFVWVGAALAIASGTLAWRAFPRRETRPIAIGIAWYWASLLPVIGIVGARVAAAQDRYLYQPLMGLGLALATALAFGATRRAAGLRMAKSAVIASVLLAIPMLMFDRYLCTIARDPVARADRAVALNPGDPRAIEYLAAAYFFVGDEKNWRKTIDRAKQAAQEGPQFFRDPADRAAFHRRMSFQHWGDGNLEASFEEARKAIEFDPDSPASWFRLAVALRSAGALPDAARAYEELASRLKADTRFRALRLTEFGDLLLDGLGRPDLAAPRYRAALESEDCEGDLRALATVGLALCEVRAGDGARGREMIENVLRVRPNLVRGLLALGESHLRSHRWEEAARAYVTILQSDPLNYAALRGFQAVCEQVGRWNEAAAAWHFAAMQDPSSRTFASFAIWSGVCAGITEAAASTDELLAADPANPLACLAKMLLAARGRDWGSALDWIARSTEGVPIPGEWSQMRAEATLRLLAESEGLGAEVALLRALLLSILGQPDAAMEALNAFELAHPEHDRTLVERVRATFTPE